MVNLLGRLVNKPVLLSVRPAAENSVPFVCMLLGLESCGVWIGGETALEALGVSEEVDPAIGVFVPFAQIVFLTEASLARQVEIAKAHGKYRPSHPDTSKRAKHKKKG